MSTDQPIDAASADRADRLRAMNELIRGRRIEFEGPDLGIHAIMCECIDPRCSAMLQVADEDLRAARTDASWFLVDPDHVGSANVVSRANSHCVVQMPTG